MVVLGGWHFLRARYPCNTSSMISISSNLFEQGAAWGGPVLQGYLAYMKPPPPRNLQ